MNNIITSDKAIIINKEAIPKSSREVIKLNNGVRLFNVNKNESVDYITEETTIDGVQAESPQQLFDYFLANGFKSNSGGGSDITVDQSYNPNSTNPQSGTSVAEALTPISEQLMNTPDFDAMNNAIEEARQNVTQVVDANSGILTFWSGTQVEYDSITNKLSNRLYVIK